jgi:hypothetical protein
MASEGGAGKGAGQESIVLASFKNRDAAEHMLMSLGRGFRKKAREGGATALVVSGNKDGSRPRQQVRLGSRSARGALQRDRPGGRHAPLSVI